MAITLDKNLLIEIGLGSLPETEKDALLGHIYETLEMRVGMRLADQMTNEQLEEFERYFQAKDDNGAFHWLETNFPNYKDIVQEEFNKLKEEVRQAAPQILASAASQATPGAQPQQPIAAAQPAPMQQPMQQPLPPQYQAQQPPMAGYPQQMPPQPPQAPPMQQPPEQQPPQAAA